MVYLIDRHVEDYLHVLANVNTIKILQEVYPNDKFCFVSAEKHNQKVQSYFKESNNLRFIFFRNRRQANSVWKFFQLLGKPFQDFCFFWRYFRRLTNNDVVFVCHIYPHSLILLKVLKFFYPKIRLAVLLHGEVEYVFFSKTIFEKIIGFLYWISFKISTPKFFYLFLTDISKSIVIESNKIADKEVVSIELPTFPSRAVDDDFSSNFEFLRFAHIGSAGKRKNVHFLFEIASQLEDLLDRQRIKLEIIGVLEGSIVPYLNKKVLNYVNDSVGYPLSREKYEREISGIDYALFFYGENDFLLRSSAAFFDAMFFEKPIIALRNKFFTSIFEQHGELGYLCENIHAMKDTIRTVTKLKSENKNAYYVFKRNIKIYKMTLSIKSIAENLKFQMEQLGHLRGDQN